MSSLTQRQYDEIERIAQRANQEFSLDFNKCYSILLFYYLTQTKQCDIEEVPIEYNYSVRLLYKNPKSSYLHYLNEIEYSSDPYAKGIKQAEVIELGDDPRCPF